MTKPIEREKCVPKDYLYCTTMERCLDPNESHAKGLSTSSVFALSTMKRLWAYVVYRTGTTRGLGGGIALKMCPWCGVSLLPPWAGKVEMARARDSATAKKRR